MNGDYMRGEAMGHEARFWMKGRQDAFDAGYTRRTVQVRDKEGCLQRQGRRDGRGVD